jgi:hypothetical protein
MNRRCLCLPSFTPPSSGPFSPLHVPPTLRRSRDNDDDEEVSPRKRPNPAAASSAAFSSAGPSKAPANIVKATVQADVPKQTAAKATPLAPVLPLADDTAEEDESDNDDDATVDCGNDPDAFLHAADDDRTVIDDTLNTPTHQEAMQNAKEVTQAMRDELGRWCKLKAWTRHSRAASRNTLDARWVIKWKMIKNQRAFRARLTARGFLDKQQKVLNTHTGTTSKWAQRLVVVAAVEFQWQLYSADISQAFLRGITFEELAKEPGEIIKQVEVDLSPGSAEILRELPGYAGFDPSKETLRLVKPGFGLKDAPRLWAILLQRALVAAGL